MQFWTFLIAQRTASCSYQATSCMLLSCWIAGYKLKYWIYLNSVVMRKRTILFNSFSCQFRTQIKCLYVSYEHCVLCDNFWNVANSASSSLLLWIYFDSASKPRDSSLLQCINQLRRILFDIFAHHDACSSCDYHKLSPQLLLSWGGSGCPSPMFHGGAGYVSCQIIFATVN